MKKMKTTLLTLCLAAGLAVIAKWTPSLVSADTTAVVCGQVLNFIPPTATTGGSIRINSTALCDCSRRYHRRAANSATRRQSLPRSDIQRQQ